MKMLLTPNQATQEARLDNLEKTPNDRPLRMEYCNLDQ